MPDVGHVFHNSFEVLICLINLSAMSQQQAGASTALSLTLLHIRIYVIAGRFTKCEVCTNIHIVDGAFHARGASSRIERIRAGV